MRSHQPPSRALLDLVIQAARVEQPTPTQDTTVALPIRPAEVVDRRDERGTGYRGDFPNPLGEGKGCF